MTINAKKLALQYSLLQGAYWMLYCTIYGFATVFLLDRGFDNTEIGIVVALGNILGVIFQPIFASIADSSRKLSLHKLTALLSAAAVILLILLFLTPNLLIPVAVLFLLTDTIVQIIQPLINSVSMYYVNRGIEVDFGVARGIGSVAYAAASSLLGMLTEIYHSAAVIGLGILLLAVIVLVLFSMPIIKAAEEEKSGEQKIKENEKKQASAGFLFKYKGFVLVLAGITCLFTTHFMVNNYLIQIVASLGGTSAQMGTAMSIAAVAELPTMFLFSKIVKKLSSGKLLLVSALFFTVKAAVFLFAGSMGFLYAAQILQFGGFAICIPASVYYVNSVMDELDKFKGQAVMAGTNTLGGVFGSLFGGFLIDRLGVSNMLMIGTGISCLGVILIGVFADKKVK